MLFRRFFCLLLALLLALGCAAAEAEAPRFVLAGLDATQYRRWDQSLFFSRMEERTGVVISPVQYTSAEAWTQAKAAMEAGQEGLPDGLFKAALSPAECIALREKGVLLDVKPYLEACCPHLWALLQAQPEALAGITLPDGSIAALPYFPMLPVQNYLWVNQSWLDALRLDRPTTAQEFVDMLTAFKTRDPNRNGRPDEIPLGFAGPFDLKFLAHAFGLIANDYNVFAQDGQARFMPLEENYRLFVLWCRDLFQAGLLDPKGFSIVDEQRRVTDEKALPTYGAIFAPLADSVFSVSWADQYELLLPLTHEGSQFYRSFTGPILRGAFAVTSACKDPEALLRWVDELYSESGAVLASYGLENTDYLVDGDGTWRYLDTVTSHYDLFRAESLIDGDGVRPGIAAVAFQNAISGAPQVQKLVEEQEQFGRFVRLPFPYCSLTAAQEALLAPLQAQIGYLVDTQLARWVSGEDELTDESFSAFEARLKEAGLTDFMHFWQDVLDSLEEENTNE